MYACFSSEQCSPWYVVTHPVILLRDCPIEYHRLICFGLSGVGYGYKDIDKFLFLFDFYSKCFLALYNFDSVDIMLLVSGSGADLGIKEFMYICNAGDPIDYNDID